MKKQEPGKTSTIQWARSPQQADTIGIAVTRSQQVDVDIGMDQYRPHNIHPLENTSGDSLDRKGAFAV